MRFVLAVQTNNWEVNSGSRVVLMGPVSLRTNFSANIKWSFNEKSLALFFNLFANASRRVMASVVELHVIDRTGF